MKQNKRANRLAFCMDTYSDPVSQDGHLYEIAFSEKTEILQNYAFGETIFARGKYPIYLLTQTKAHMESSSTTSGRKKSFPHW